jgi:hypothetical protein
MKLPYVSFVVLLLSAFLFTSCAKPEQRRGMVTESKALELAKAEFLKTGRKLDDYNVTWETDSSGGKWIVWFDKKGRYALPGGKHAVTVEKATGKLVFMPGQ